MADLTLTSELRARTGSSRALERAALQAVLTRIRRGAYVDADEWNALSPGDRHLARIEAARRAARKEPLFSHESAAVLHGIPTIHQPPARVHTTVTNARATSNRAVIRTCQDVPHDDIEIRDDGLRVTTPARTAIDLAAGGSALGGRFAVDHVRRHCDVSLDELRETLSAAGRIRGVRLARLAIDRSSGLCDSPLETLVLVRCADLGFARPEQQVEMRGIDGRSYRVDFAWSGERVLLEADGRTKYGALAAATGATPEDVVWAEKRREDALRPMCDALVRVTWTDAWHGRELERRLSAAGAPRTRRRAISMTF